jgi:hypothetical protein
MDLTLELAFWLFCSSASPALAFQIQVRCNSTKIQRINERTNETDAAKCVLRVQYLTVSRAFSPTEDVENCETLKLVYQVEQQAEHFQVVGQINA